uniref:Uncharacterized protein n=1 Tax=Lactuca sativa TaxID=4236 RepID=A0A9R1XUC7_LACSA|nr:hypothetical protein LSAT_V11C100040850 [Lactuca sativa]
MVQVAVNRSFNQITISSSIIKGYFSRLTNSDMCVLITKILQVDGDTSTNDTIIALASGLSGSNRISSLHSSEGNQRQMCLDAVMQGLAKSIA